jgi:hypothetical protein
MSKKPIPLSEIVLLSQKQKEALFGKCIPLTLHKHVRFGGKKISVPKAYHLDHEAYSTIVTGSNKWIEQLYVLARNGDPRATSALLQIARNAVAHLEDLAFSNPSQLRSNASKSHIWPSFISTAGWVQKNNKLLLKQLTFAKATKIPRIQPDKTATQVALQLRQWLRQNEDLIMAAYGIEELSPENWSEWFKVAWDGIMDMTKGRPDRHPFLKRIGAGAAESKTRQYNLDRKGNERLQTKQNGDSKEMKASIARSVMREAIKAAFRSSI